MHFGYFDKIVFWRPRGLAPPDLTLRLRNQALLTVSTVKLKYQCVVRAIWIKKTTGYVFLMWLYDQNRRSLLIRVKQFSLLGCFD